MGILSDKLTSITFGNDASNIKLERGTITSIATTPFGFSSNGTGSDMRFSNPAGNVRLHVQGGVWNALWNDYADFQQLAGELIPGKCYRDTFEGATVCSERCQLSVIGIASDTFGMAVGNGRFEREVPIAVSGWVLAYVDSNYECGTPLTNDQYGNLTEMTLNEKRDYPERLVAIYKKPESEKTFGTEGNKIEVNGRHWVKIK